MCIAGACPHPITVISTTSSGLVNLNRGPKSSELWRARKLRSTAIRGAWQSTYITGMKRLPRRRRNNQHHRSEASQESIDLCWMPWSTRNHFLKPLSFKCTVNPQLLAFQQVSIHGSVKMLNRTAVCGWSESRESGCCRPPFNQES